jgi:response regulator RpfG family c-di-GMP phosphodiesterase
MASNSTKRPILIVDDEPEMLHSLKDLLRHDYQVFTAPSGAEGLKILQMEIIHLVMTDQRMPEMTGVELLKHVKNEHPAAIRIIFTGYADMKAVIEAINQGNVFRFVTKPWEPEELLAVLGEAGEHHDHIIERYHLLDDLARHEIACGQFKDALLDGSLGTLTPDGAAAAVGLLNINRELIARLQQTLAGAMRQPI